MIKIIGFNISLLSFVLVPLVSSFLLVFIEKQLKTSRLKKNLIHFIAFIGALINISLAILFSTSILTTGEKFYTEISFLVLQADMTSLFFILIFTIIHFGVNIYCIKFMDSYADLAYFYALLFAVLTGLNLVVLASDFFTLFVAYEGMALCGYGMVGYYRNKESSEAGFKYLVMSSTGSMLILFGIALLYGVAGRLDFSYFETIALQNNLISSVALILMLVGFGVLGSMFILNTWLPDAYQAAPIPASTMFSVVDIAGIYGILRTLTLLIIPLNISISGIWGNLLIFIGIITSLQGNLFVLLQFTRSDSHARNFKRILAFSTITHMGYLITGLGAANIMGLSGVLLHALNHAVAKSMLFMIAGYLIFSTGSYSLDQYKGLGRRDPVIGTCLVIGLFSLGAIPLTGGFWSLLQIILGLFENGNPIGIIAGFSMLVFTFIAEVGYLWIIKYIIMDKPDLEEKYIQGFDNMNLRNNGIMKFVIVLLAIFIIILGIFPRPFMEFTLQAASNLLG